MKNKRFILISITLIGGTVACMAQNHTPPEEAAQKFAAGLGMTVKGASCTGYESDNDGYVSCTVNLQDGYNHRTMMLQCAALNDPSGCDRSKGSRYADGCKAPVAKVQINQAAQ